MIRGFSPNSFSGKNIIKVEKKHDWVSFDDGFQNMNEKGLWDCTSCVLQMVLQLRTLYMELQISDLI